jgi:hypothetical protein
MYLTVLVFAALLLAFVAVQVVRRPEPTRLFVPIRERKPRRSHRTHL